MTAISGLACGQRSLLPQAGGVAIEVTFFADRKKSPQMGVLFFFCLIRLLPGMQ
jgi:hypothetical protein